MFPTAANAWTAAGTAPPAAAAAPWWPPAALMSSPPTAAAAADATQLLASAVCCSKDLAVIRSQANCQQHEPTDLFCSWVCEPADAPSLLFGQGSMPQSGAFAAATVPPPSQLQQLSSCQTAFQSLQAAPQMPPQAGSPVEQFGALALWGQQDGLTLEPDSVFPMDADGMYMPGVLDPSVTHPELSGCVGNSPRLLLYTPTQAAAEPLEDYTSLVPDTLHPVLPEVMGTHAEDLCMSWLHKRTNSTAAAACIPETPPMAAPVLLSQAADPSLSAAAAAAAFNASPADEPACDLMPWVSGAAYGSTPHHHHQQQLLFEPQHSGPQLWEEVQAPRAAHLPQQQPQQQQQQQRDTWMTDAAAADAQLKYDQQLAFESTMMTEPQLSTTQQAMASTWAGQLSSEAYFTGTLASMPPPLNGASTAAFTAGQQWDSVTQGAEAAPPAGRKPKSKSTSKVAKSRVKSSTSGVSGPRKRKATAAVAVYEPHMPPVSTAAAAAATAAEEMQVDEPFWLQQPPPHHSSAWNGADAAMVTQSTEMTTAAAAAADQPWSDIPNSAAAGSRPKRRAATQGLVKIQQAFKESAALDIHDALNSMLPTHGSPPQRRPHRAAAGAAAADAAPTYSSGFDAVAGKGLTPSAVGGVVLDLGSPLVSHIAASPGTAGKMVPDSPHLALAAPGPQYESNPDAIFTNNNSNSSAGTVRLAGVQRASVVLDLSGPVFGGWCVPTAAQQPMEAQADAAPAAGDVTATVDGVQGGSAAEINTAATGSGWIAPDAAAQFDCNMQTQAGAAVAEKQMSLAAVVLAAALPGAVDAAVSQAAAQAPGNSVSAHTALLAVFPRSSAGTTKVDGSSNTVNTATTSVSAEVATEAGAAADAVSAPAAVDVDVQAVEPTPEAAAADVTAHEQQVVAVVEAAAADAVIEAAAAAEVVAVDAAIDMVAADAVAAAAVVGTPANLRRSERARRGTARANASRAG